MASHQKSTVCCLIRSLLLVLLLTIALSCLSIQAQVDESQVTRSRLTSHPVCMFSGRVARLCVSDITCVQESTINHLNEGVQNETTNNHSDGIGRGHDSSEFSSG